MQNQKELSFFYDLLLSPHIYSGYRKSSYPFICFHILLCCVIMLNCFKKKKNPT